MSKKVFNEKTKPSFSQVLTRENGITFFFAFRMFHKYKRLTVVPKKVHALKGNPTQSIKERRSLSAALRAAITK